MAFWVTNDCVIGSAVWLGKPRYSEKAHGWQSEFACWKNQTLPIALGYDLEPGPKGIRRIQLVNPFKSPVAPKRGEGGVSLILRTAARKEGSHAEH